MKLFELKPTNGRKSFNGNASVVQGINSKTEVISHLYSYFTKVAEYNHETNEIKATQEERHLTNTTLTHINAFFELYGFNKATKKEILNKK